MPDSFSPPSAVRSAALRGLRLRQRYRRGGLDNQQASEQGVGSGVQRAADLANGRSISLETIGRMVSFFARHAENWRPETQEPDGGPTAGTIAHYLWGGPAGKAWAEAIHRQYGLRQKAAPVSFAVFKQADGRYRWVARSSNAFRDRDGEIVSTKALADDVERADRTKEYGPLRFWHMPGVDLGDCDFNWLHGRTLIESGTFRDPYVAQRIAEKSADYADYQVSIGFRHPHGEPDKNGVFHHIQRFERSLVPAGRAANPFTSFEVIKEKQHMNDNMKVAALKALLDGDESRLQALLAGAASAEKTADAMGVQFKEKVDLNALTPDQLLDYAITAKEKQMAEAAEKPAPADEEDGDVVTKMTACTKKMEEVAAKMEGYMSKMMGESKKEADGLTAVTVATNAHSDRIAQLESELAQRTKELSALAAQVSALKSEFPAGVGVGVRPSEIEETVNPGAQATKEVGGTVGVLDGFLSFITGGVGG